MSQSMEVDHTGKRCGSTLTSQAGVWHWPVALLCSQREGSPGQDGGEVWAAFLCPHIALRLRGCCRHRAVCRIHSVRTHLLVGNLMAHGRRGWCNPMTPHRGLGINYTLESCEPVCAAVGLGNTPSLSRTPCARAGGAEP